MNKTNRTITILIFLIINWVGTSAQLIKEDVIYLNNGSVIRGKILKNGNDSLKIETHCRNIFVFKNADIIKVIKERYKVSNNQAIKQLTITQQKGFYNITTFGLLTGKTEARDAQVLSFQTILGYNYNQYLGSGLGIGIEKLQTEIIPVFLSLKSNFSNKVNSPILNFTIGYSFPLSKTKNEDNKDYHYEGGMNLGFDVGICSYKSAKRAFLITVGYRYQLVKETSNNTSWYYPNSIEKNTYEFNKIAIKIGFMFI